MHWVDQVRVTTLVEDSVNPFLKERDGVRRREAKEGNLLAEHGWAALVETVAGSDRHAVLLDAGTSETTLLHNMACLEVNPVAIDAIVVSHGHDDHTGAVAAVIRRAGRSLPIYAHPDAFRERWRIPPDRPRQGPWRIESAEWESAGGEIVLTPAPQEIVPGCIVTGGIPRQTEFERPPKHYYYREDDTFHPDTLSDDQAVVIGVKGRGLLVVSGCAHAGIVNTVRYAQQIADEKQVWAVVGGFHLGRSSQQIIDSTVEGLKEARPTIVSPGHCTGFEAFHTFAQAMPAQFVLNVVGTVIYTEGDEA